MGELVTEDTLLNSFFASVFTDKTDPQFLNVREKVWKKEGSPKVKEYWVRHHLDKLDTLKSVVLDRIHTQVLKGLAKVAATPISVTFERSWRIGEVPEVGKKSILFQF